MKFLTPDARFGATLESLLVRRERMASHEDFVSGNRVKILELGRAILDHIKPSMKVLEVDAGPGHFTRALIRVGVDLSILEPTGVFVRSLQKLVEDKGAKDKVKIYHGFSEELPKDEHYDVALISFPARRGTGLLALVNELVGIVNGEILVVLPDDGSLDWAYLTRATAMQGLEARAEFYVDHDVEDPNEAARAALIVIKKAKEFRELKKNVSWDLAARTITVPYPVPRGAATRLVRYFMAGGDRAVIIKTEAVALNRLYGNLRTAAHRIARDEVTVRRIDDGVQLMLIPHADEQGH